MFYENDVPVPAAIVRDRFYGSAYDAGVPRSDAEQFWHAAMGGDPVSRELIEDVTGVEIKIGFGSRD